jgi:hypothetical protein
VIASLRSTWILLATLVLGVVLACGGDSQEAAPAAGAPAEPSAPAAAAKPAPRITTPPVFTTELPADFPTDVPLYPGAEVTQARVSAGMGMSVSFTTGDDVDKVASHYADSFAAEGWSTEIKPSPDGSAIFADKTERRVATMVRRMDEGTQIELIIVNEP